MVDTDLHIQVFNSTVQPTALHNTNSKHNI